MPKLPKICASCGDEYGPDALFCSKDGTPLGGSRSKPGNDPYLGLVIGEQLEVRRLIGIGSMGRVYLAFQRGTERDVALKLLHRELSGNAAVAGRFLREARIASSLSHPNIVQVLLSGQLPDVPVKEDIGGELYIVMEYVDGISLLSALAAAGDALALPRALHVVLQICDAVGEAHERGVVHRDLKPENVMLLRRGDDADFVKVVDFGIARVTRGGELSATQAGLIFGSAKYISPEGSQGEPVGPQADVYAISTLLYQCLAGRAPFEDESAVALLLKHAQQAPPVLHLVPRASYVPQPLVACIMRNLAKHPRERASNARELGRELVQAARASGLVPEQLFSRSLLLGQARSGASSFASIQRTQQMELSSNTSELISSNAGTVAIAADPGGPEGASAPVRSSSSADIVKRSVAVRHDEPEPANKPARGRVALVVLACFVLGAGMAALGAHGLGYLTARRPAHSAREVPPPSASAEPPSPSSSTGRWL